MQSVDNEKVHSDGGEHKIQIGVVYPDTDNPNENHSIVCNFTPTLAVGSQTPQLELSTIIHKKYWDEEEVTPTTFSEEPGEELVDSYGWFDGPYNPASVPTRIQEQVTSLFGIELADGTLEPDADTVDVELPTVPENATVRVFDITLRIDGSYTEELNKDDPRVGDGHFTSHIKDGETGEILNTYHQLSHSMSWWFTPDTESDEPVVQIEKCVHKTWDDRMTLSFEEENPGETVVEAHKSPSNTPSIASLPKDIAASLSDWLGEPLVKRSIEQAGGEMPTVVYECFDCGQALEVTPRDTCANCGSDSLCRYDSREEYEEYITDRDADEEEFISALASAEVTVSTEDELKE